VGLSNGGKVNSVDVREMTLVTDFERYKGNVVNVIPPQKAGRIADLAGITNNTGWCPINPDTFESTLQPNIHVVGDATIAGGMPKSAFAANAQAKVCAAAVAKLLAGEKPDEPRLINTCYSFVAPDYGISVANLYRPKDGMLVDVGGGVSPLNASAAFRAQEAAFANGWFNTITEEVFG
jgi:NADPH-dependent 2,4-dienoyl-CoA reductase/sulfur reductase-like enzyme